MSQFALHDWDKTIEVWLIRLWFLGSSSRLNPLMSLTIFEWDEKLNPGVSHLPLVFSVPAPDLQVRSAAFEEGFLIHLGPQV